MYLKIIALFKTGYCIRTIQELLEPRVVSTTMIYSMSGKKGGHGLQNPVDRL
jgi:site-specific recombinase XerD